MIADFMRPCPTVWRLRALRGWRVRGRYRVIAFGKGVSKPGCRLDGQVIADLTAILVFLIASHPMKKA